MPYPTSRDGLPAAIGAALQWTVRRAGTVGLIEALSDLVAWIDMRMPWVSRLQSERIQAGVISALDTRNIISASSSAGKLTLSQIPVARKWPDTDGDSGKRFRARVLANVSVNPEVEKIATVIVETDILPSVQSFRSEVEEAIAKLLELMPGSGDQEEEPVLAGVPWEVVYITRRY